MTVVHRRDPRVKIIATIILSIITLQATPVELICLSLFVAACSLWARIHPRVMLQALRPAFPLFLCLFLVYALTTPGRPLLPLPDRLWRLSYEGVYFGCGQIWKFFLLLITACILTATTTQSDLALGLKKLLQPLQVFGLSSDDLALMLILALRFIPTLREEMNRIKEAQLARGASFQVLRRGGIQAIAQFAQSLSCSVFQRCDDLVAAMEARGYQPGYRTYLHELAFTPLDYWILAVLLLALIAAFAVH
ncbi:MAG: energy-coupling factor transporter transmembrane protein EcfT [Peptococcaceae bacterium]|jgi:biotin transport system permease protein/energy-coupling factor transport system permease protein|nr:energy-coupling factor transporter transmembrane protein EcfT [Peptococcaceae bacterium]